MGPTARYAAAARSTFKPSVASCRNRRAGAIFTLSPLRIPGKSSFLHPNPRLKRPFSVPGRIRAPACGSRRPRQLLPLIQEEVVEMQRCGRRGRQPPHARRVCSPDRSRSIVGRGFGSPASPREFPRAMRPAISSLVPRRSAPLCKVIQGVQPGKWNNEYNSAFRA